MASSLWFEAHIDLPDHPKTTECAHMLGIDPDLLVGKLYRIWSWCLDNRQDGFIPDHEAYLFADKMRWTKSKRKLLDALLHVPNGKLTGFVEKVEGGYQFHNWRKYAGKLIEKRRKDNERKQAGNSGNIPSENPSEIPQENPSETPAPVHRKSAGIPITYNQDIDLSSLNSVSPTVECASTEQVPDTHTEEMEARLKAFNSLWENTKGILMPRNLFDFLRIRLTAGYDKKLLTEALEKSLDANEPVSYMRKIMNGWEKAGILTWANYLAKEAPQPSKGKAPQKQYDNNHLPLDEIEGMISRGEFN